jgi:hypothetical protein
VEPLQPLVQLQPLEQHLLLVQQVQVEQGNLMQMETEFQTLSKLDQIQLIHLILMVMELQIFKILTQMVTEFLIELNQLVHLKTHL